MPNIKDVAKKANVSVATVSRVINNKGYVNEETRKLVEDAIKELNYTPNELARALFNKHSKIIGVVVPHLNTFFYGQLIESIENAAFKKGYKMMLCSAHLDPLHEVEYISLFQQYNIAGIIIALDTKNILDYKELNVPLVSVDHFLDEDIPSITSENYQGGVLAAKQLIKSKATKFAQFRGPSFLPTTIERSKGFEDELRKHNITSVVLDTDLVLPEVDLMTEFFIKNPDINGVFCHADRIALNVLNIAESLGKKIPQDLQVISFDNIYTSQFSNPPLTTISQSIAIMGERSVEKLINLVDKKPLNPTHEKIPVRLIKRNTTLS